MGIPHLLIAPKIPIGPQLPTDLQQVDDEDEGEVHEEHTDRSIHNEGQSDFRGRYEDGAYIAQPDWEAEQVAQQRRDNARGEGWEASAMLDEEDAEAALCEAYYTSLKNRYNLLREKLQARPPASAVAALPRINSFHVGSFAPKSSVSTVWNRRLRETDPWPAQVASMDKDSVIRVLRIMLSGRFLRRGYDLEERTSRWLWALLARLPDRGEMSHTDIGWVRDLGRRAVLMTQSLADMANLREALEGEGMDLGVHDAVDESSDDKEVLQDFVVEEEDGVAESGESDGDKFPSEEKAPPVLPAEMEASSEHPAVPTEAEASVDQLGAPRKIDVRVEDDQNSEAMDCSEDGEIAEDGEEVEEGEVADEHPAVESESLEAAKLRILAELDHATAAEEEEARAAENQLRARLNMRATLNMILTVAGEFYGQRDLLEFRDPFPGM
jgi:survival motor neuron (SMN) interacting protein 1 (SIP1)